MRLAHQGTVVVAILLCIELVFLGWLVWSLDKAQEATVQYERAMAIVSRANGLLKVFVDGTSTLTFYAITRNEVYGKKYDESVESIEPNIRALKALVKSDREGRIRVDKIADLALEASNQFTEAKKELDEGEFLDFTRLRKKVMPILTKIMTEIQTFVVQQEKYAKTLNPDAAKKIREQARFFILYVGIPMNVIGALMAMGWFTRRITRRLDIVAGNTKRLESGEELTSPLSGHDEISTLDAVFHGMATALKESAEKEKVATEFIKFSEQNLRTLLDNIPVALVTVDKQGTIESVNPQAGKLFGYRTDALWQMNIGDLFVHPSQVSGETFLSDLLTRTETRAMEVQARTASGGTLPVEVSIDAFETAGGNRLLATIIDITERHEMERLKREFVAMVSHDLRTPLMTVQASLNLLSEGALGDLPKEAKTVATKAEVQVERLRDLVSNLLDLARIESGKFDVTCEDELLMDIFQNSAESVTGLAQEHDIKIEVANTDIEVHADASRLVQVNVNLLSNAIKFSEKGSSVVLSAVLVDDWVEIRVQDFGRGIPHDQQSKIFSRFEQVEADDNRKKKGTGLGLSICQAIIEGHGGQIGVNSEPGKGSTFWYRVRPA